jgi:hypothetical protein
MENNKIEDQSKVYLFELMNTARENGFKPDEKWQLTMASEAQKTKFQKDYYPAIATKVLPEMLLQVYQSVKAGLNQVLNSDEELINKKTVHNEGLSYIVAYIPARERR